jgi:hypothetical protein
MLRNVAGLAAQIAEEASGFGDLGHTKNGAEPRYPERMVIRVRRRMVSLEVGDIDWVEGASQYCRLHTRQGQFLLSRPLGSVETELDPERFFRIHRSAIVNSSSVGEVRSGGDGAMKCTCAAAKRCHRRARNVPAAHRPSADGQVAYRARDVRANRRQLFPDPVPAPGSGAARDLRVQSGSSLRENCRYFLPARYPDETANPGQSRFARPRESRMTLDTARRGARHSCSPPAASRGPALAQDRPLRKSITGTRIANPNAVS